MSITFQARLVPMNHDENMGDSLAARLHDPLWLLARQWQFGEFQGEDTGSIVAAALDARCAALSRYALLRGKLPYQDKYTDDLPLEALVEGETALPKGGQENYRLRAEAGQHFLRLLRLHDMQLEAKYRTKYQNAYQLNASTDPSVAAQKDQASTRFLSIIERRAVDGVVLYQHMEPAVRNNTLPAAPTVDLADQPEVLEVAKAWVEWFEDLYGMQFHGPSWDGNRMEYELAASAQGNFAERPETGQEVRLDAHEWRGGHLDWYAFDVDPTPESARILNATKAVETIQRSFFPTPMRFSGMPTARYWEFEDGQVNLGKVSAAAEDLPRLILLEFMLIYGNEFFSFPIQMDVGAVCKILSLEVEDTFGVKTKIPPAFGPGKQSWSMYSLSYALETGKEGAANMFFLAPALGPMQVGQPFEQVRFLRDEMANLVWAVERRVLGQNGQPLDRFEASQAGSAGSDRNGPAPQELVYHLSSANLVPEYWFPLVPVQEQATSDSPYVLKPGRLLHRMEPRSVPAPWGEILAGQAIEIPEEEIPREGLEISREYHLTRWLDGRAVLWIGRRRKPGRGEGSSGLRYDFLSPD